MSGHEHAVTRRWTPPPTQFAHQPDHRRPARSAGDGAARSTGPSLRVGPAGDEAEAQADRIAASVAVGMPVREGIGRSGPAGSALQRQPAVADPAAEAAKEKAAKDKEAEKQLDELKKAALAEAIKVEPLKGLVAKGKEFLATPAGKIALGEAIAAVITASVLAKRELPVTTWTQDLGELHPSLSGITVKARWEGPANDPTKAGVDLSYAPKSGPLQGASATLGGDTGSTTPGQVRGGLGYAPTGGAIRGSVFSLGATTTLGKSTQFQAGIGYTMPSGLLKGATATLGATADTGGGVGGTVGFTIPLGSPAKKRPKDRRAESLQRLAARSGTDAGAATAPPSVDAVLAQPGAALPGGVRADMESGIGADFSRVRIHADARAAASARDVGALAYTVGPHVVFGTGRWRPETTPGRRVLAHELVHVVQQQASPPTRDRP